MTAGRSSIAAVADGLESARRAALGNLDLAERNAPAYHKKAECRRLDSKHGGDEVVDLPGSDGLYTRYQCSDPCLERLVKPLSSRRGACRFAKELPSVRIG